MNSDRPSSVKILVDNASWWNLGDIAMAEGGISELLNLYENCELYVVQRFKESLECSWIWNCERVHRIDEVVLEQKRLSLFSKLPVLWRYSLPYQAQTIKWLLSGLGKRFYASSLAASIQSAPARTTTLGEYCLQFDALYFIGGGNITESFPNELLRKCAWTSCFAEQKKPVFLTGQQVGPFRSSTVRKAAMQSLALASFVGIREPLDSMEYCRQAGLKDGRYALMGDDSFGLRAAEEGEVAAVLSRYGVQAGQFIAINLRVARYIKWSSRRVDGLAALVRRLADHFRMPVVVVPIIMQGDDSDVASGQRLASIVGHDILKVMGAKGLTASLARAVLGQAFGAVGVSYHFCTFSLSEGVPAICLHEGKYYDQKAKGLAALWEDSRLALSLSDVTTDQALTQVTDLFEDFAVRRNLSMRSKELHAKWHQEFSAALASTFPNKGHSL